MTKAVSLKQLGDLCHVIGGGTPPKNKPAFYTGDIRWATVRDMNVDVIDDTAFKITGEAVKACATNIIPPGNVIIASRVGLGKVCLTRYPTAINQDLRGIIPHDVNALSVKYLYWWCKSISGLIEREGKGATVKGVTLPFIKSLKIPMPLLAEQKRVVAILDQTFEAIDRAKANARKSALNAHELFDSCVTDAVAKRDALWNDTSLYDASSIFVDSAHRTPKYQTQGFPALRPRDVVNGRLDLLSAACVSKHEYEIQTKRYKPRPGDIVYSRELSYGWAALLPEEPLVCLSQGMCVFRPAENVITDYLLFLLNSRVIRAEAESRAVGTAHPHINLGDIKAYKIPMPALAVQKTLAKKWTEMQAQCEQLVTVTQRKEAELANLRESLLKGAFAGKL